MRIVCPNCAAQYEIPADVMPQEGRDVQCSNCATTWFQHHVDFPPAPKPAPAPTPEPPQAVEPPAPPHPRVKPEVETVLRQEAEREAKARQADAQAGLETQPELGLPAPTKRQEAAQRARDARARMTAETPEAVAPAQAPQAKRAGKQLLPDIEEINSTLRTGQDRTSPSTNVSPTEAKPAKPKQRRRGFRRGFLLAALLFGAGLAIYTVHPQLAEAIPQAAPYLDMYVAQIDQLRVRLDGAVGDLDIWVQDLARKLDELAATSRELQ